MSLKDMFNAHLLDHYRYPRHFGKIDHPDVILDGVNAACGDEITLYVKVDDTGVEQVAFEGKACAICIASCSMFCEKALGSSFNELEDLREKVYKMLHGEELNDESRRELGDMAALEGVSKLSSRVKCATLIWETWALARKQLSGS